MHDHDGKHLLPRFTVVTLGVITIFGFAFVGTSFGQLRGTDFQPPTLPQIRHPDDVHRGANEPMPAPPRRVPFFPRPSADEARMLDRLDDPTTIRLSDVPFEKAISELGRIHDIEIWIDGKAMADAGLDRQKMDSSPNFTNLPLRKCLQLLLEPAAMTYLVEDDVMKVTTIAATQTDAISRVYPIGDLCTTTEDANELLESIECGLGLNREANGGRRLAVSSRAKTLVVRDSHAVHDKVQNLLLALRDAQQSQSSATPEQPVKP